MKSHEIEKQLKKEAETNAPDIYDRIVLAAQAEGLSLPKAKRKEPARNKEYAKPKRRKLTLAFFTSFAAVAACLAITLPIALKGVTGNPPSPVRLSATDVYGMGAVSTVRLLGSNMSASALGTFASVKAATSDNSAAQSDPVKEQAEKFNEYFTALDSFLGDDIVSTTTRENTDTAIPYETEMTVKGKDFNGNDVKYVMYYTETLVKEETEDGEREKEYTLEGIMKVDGTDYFLTGERSFETEDDETENEIKIRAYADKNDLSSYIEMEQEHSIEADETEKEYSYGIYVNGELTEETSVKFETERNKDKEKTEYELEFKSGEAKGKYKVKKETGKDVMKVEYEIDKDKGEFSITPHEGGKYLYTFSDGSSFTL